MRCQLKAGDPNAVVVIPTASLIIPERIVPIAMRCGAKCFCKAQVHDPATAFTALQPVERVFGPSVRPFGIFGLLFVLWTLYLLNKQASNKIFFGLVSAEALFFLWFGLFNHTLYNFNFWMIFFAASLVVNQQSSTISFAQEPELPSKKSRRKRKSRRRRSSRSSRWEPSHSSKKHREG